MSARTNQIEHLVSIERKAEELKRQGYSVKADINGYSKPPTIGGLVPNLRAKRGDQIILGQVMREEDLTSGEEKCQCFVDYAAGKEDTSFRIYLSSGDRSTKLYKIY